MSIFGFEFEIANQPASPRLLKTCFVLAIAISCANWLGLKSEGQTSDGSAPKTSANTPDTKNPEESVDVDSDETILMPMTPAAPIAIQSVREVEGGAVFKMRPGVMAVHFCDDSIVHVSYAPGDEPPEGRKSCRNRVQGAAWASSEARRNREKYKPCWRQAISTREPHLRSGDVCDSCGQQDSSGARKWRESDAGGNGESGRHLPCAAGVSFPTRRSTLWSRGRAGWSMELAGNAHRPH